jgi:N-acetylglucosaminyl-diphospho-decaprenol L-rhamnosyltransferase
MSGTAVVTAVHGRHTHLARQHASLASGSLLPDHVVVVAMGDPEVADVVAAGPLADRTHVVDLLIGPRLPLARARNVGAARAFELGADLVVFLDVDCLAGAGLLEGYLDGWRRTGTGARLLSGPVSYLDPPGAGGYCDADLAAARPHRARPAPGPGEVVLADDLRLFWSLSFALDAATWSAVGGFDEAYVGYGAEDTDFAQRAASAGASMWWVGDAPAYHQWHPVSDPPVEHVQDVVRNANLFRRRWGWFPMEGWLAAFAARGLARPDPDGRTWHVVGTVGPR